MKKVEAFIRVSVLERVKDAIASVGIEGLTVSEVSECGKEHQHLEHYRGGSTVVDTTPTLKIELLLEDFKTPQIIEAIRKAAHTGRAGDGSVCAFTVDDVVRIRTGEHGRDAI